MTETKAAMQPTDPVASFIRLLFSYRGRIGRGKYWIGVAIMLGAGNPRARLFRDGDESNG